MENGFKFIFDTNILDKILLDGFDLNIFFKENKYFVTHIQEDEINNIRHNEERKNQLLNIFNKVTAENAKLLTESFILDYSRLGGAKLGDGLIFNQLKNSDLKNINDALIGEVAIINNLILVTEDIKFSKKVKKLDGNAINFNDFKELIKYKR